MDDSRRNQKSNFDDELGEGPKWPPRPARLQPQPPPDSPDERNHPPRTGNASRYGYRVAPAPQRDTADTSGQQPRSVQETRETQIVPTVEPSHLDRGSGQPPQTTSPRQATSRMQPFQSASPSAQPQVRRPGGWQYERDEDPNSNTASPNANRGYSPGVVPQKAAQEGRYISANAPTTRRRPLRWLLWLLSALISIPLIIALAFALAWQGQYTGKVYAGVSSLDIDLGGKTGEAATKALRDKVQGFVSEPITLTWQGKIWKPSADQLGVKVNVASTVNDAYQVGRAGDFFSNSAQQWYASQSGYVVPLVVQLSEPTLQSYLNSLAEAEINQELVEGDVRLSGSDVVALPGKEGRALRVYDAMTAVRQSVAQLEAASIELPVDITRPNVSAEEVQPIQGLLAIRVSAPITATTPGGKKFTLDREALVRFTTIERNPDPNAPRHIQLGWRDNELRILADKWASEASQPAQNARFAWNTGSLSVLSESVDGFEIDASTVITSIKGHADVSDKREYALPGRQIAPAISSKDIQSLGVRELMGTGTSTFKSSSAERATNIRVAADILNGTVVPPDGTFSFLETMGGIDEAHRFVEGYVIAAERTQRGVGGGVCQVSTTTFRAAFWSGVNITERNPHSYRVGWYEANGEPVGFDAAVFDPGVDFKFVNDTPGYILIEAQVSPDFLAVNFYGTKRPGEQIKLEGPAISNRVPAPRDVYQVDTRLPPGAKKQVETAHGGLDTLISRRITAPGQPDRIDNFASSYKAWPNWYIVASPSQVPGGVAPAANPTPSP